MTVSGICHIKQHIDHWTDGLFYSGLMVYFCLLYHVLAPGPFTSVFSHYYKKSNKHYRLNQPLWLSVFSFRSALWSQCSRVSPCRLRCGRKATEFTFSAKSVPSNWCNESAHPYRSFGKRVSLFLPWIFCICRSQLGFSLSCRWRKQMLLCYLEPTWIYTEHLRLRQKVFLRWDGLKNASFWKHRLRLSCYCRQSCAFVNVEGNGLNIHPLFRDGYWEPVPVNNC